MTVEAKKEVLKYMILNDRYFRDTYSYKLLRCRYFDNVINNISEISLNYKNVIENDKIQANQFLDLLELFIKIVKERFFNVYYMENLLRVLIQTNKEMVEDYLVSNYNVNDEANLYLLKDKIYKIIINNFISNAKYVPIISSLLAEHYIDIKPVNEYTYEEATEIITILSDIVFSQRGRGKYQYLFENIEINLAHNIKMRKERKKQFDKTKYKEEFISGYTSNYESIINTYKNKEKYIKHFK